MLSELKICFILFLLSRILFFGIILIVAYTTKTELPARGGSIFHIESGLNFQETKTKVVNILLQADSSWYLEISKYSYPEVSKDNLLEKNTPKHWVFYPLFPILISLFSLFFPTLISSLIINNLLFLVSLLLIVKLGKLRNLENRKLKLLCTLICFHPLSYFFSTPHTESIFFFLLSLTIFLIERRNKFLYLSWALLLISRPSGILVSPGLAIHHFIQKKSDKISLLGVIILIIPILLFFYYLYIKTGDPFISFSNQKLWGRETLNLSNLNLNNTYLFKAWSSNLIHVSLILFSIFCSLLLLKKKEFGLVVLVLIPIVIPLMGGSLLSIGRYSLTLAPIYLSINNVKDKIFENWGELLIALFAFIYGVMCLSYSLGASFALT